MRTLKFRIWDEKRQMWDNCSNMCFGPQQELLQNGRIFQQFTGAYDADGREIYEGDFIRFFAKDRALGCGEVVYSDKEATFVVREFSTNIIGGRLVMIYPIQVVLHFRRGIGIRVAGNIFETPDLLKS